MLSVWGGLPDQTNNRCIGVDPANKGPRQRVCHKQTDMPTDTRLLFSLKKLKHIK